MAEAEIFALENTISHAELRDGQRILELGCRYMRERAPAAGVIDRLAGHSDRHFGDRNAWNAHLDGLGIAALKVSPDPVQIATEGALSGSVKAHGLFPGTVIVSDDAGQFNVGPDGLCWLHAQRLVHKLDTFTDVHRAAQDAIRDLIWKFYADLKAYRCAPTPEGKEALQARFDGIFTRKTGSFWDYLGNRLAIPGAKAIPYLPDMVRATAKRDINATGFAPITDCASGIFPPPDHHDRIRRTETRAINGNDQNVDLNRALWTQAEGMQRLKSA